MSGAAAAAASIAAAALLVVTVAAGGWLYAGASIVAAAVALTALHRSLAAAGPRPVLLAAAVCGIGAPLWAAAQPHTQLRNVPLLAAATVIAAFGLLMAGRRRTGITLAIGASSLLGVVVGLGGAALVLLRGDSAGLEWAAGFLALVLVPEVAVAAVRAAGRAELAVAARVVATGVVAGGIIGLYSPPLTLPTTVVVVAVVAAGWVGAAALERALTAERPADVPPPPRWLITTMLAAPPVYLTALVAQT